MVPERINDPSNGLCLKDWMHTRFGKFHIALKGTVRIKEDDYILRILKATNKYIIGNPK